MQKGLIYIHGKGGNAEEAKHYAPLFPGYDTVGFDYVSETPWQAENEFSEYFDRFRAKYSEVIIVANSIGAFFAISALSGKKIEKAYFISPVVDMEKLICSMMTQSDISEAELEQKGSIMTEFGEKLSWKYLCWVRCNKAVWNIPTSILYGEKDNLQSVDTIKDFASKTGAKLTVMPGGEHWFHTEEQMKFLDGWITRG